MKEIGRSNLEAISFSRHGMFEYDNLADLPNYPLYCALLENLNLLF